MMAEGAYAQEEEEEEEARSSEDDDMVGPSLGDGRTAVPDDVAYRHLRQKRALAAAKAGGEGGWVLGGFWGVGGCGCIDEAHDDSTSGFTSPRTSIHACTGGREEWMSMAPSELTGQDNSHMDRLRHTAMTSQKPRGFNQ